MSAATPTPAAEERLRRKADAARRFLGVKTPDMLRAERAELQTALSQLRQQNEALQWALIMAHELCRELQRKEETR
jgi:hypothetical protein